VPDFILYQDQAMELDILSDRIDGLVKALRVRGVYDASQPTLQRLLTEGDNNALIPVDKWMAFSEKGGLKGSIDLLPLDTLANALIQCYRAREDIKSQIYEITGISDIIRGASYASETATAQQIKGQYAGLRLRSMQEDVALYASELIRIKAQIMCQHYQPETLMMYAAVEQMTPADQQLVPQAIELLRNKPLRNFRVDIAADSLVQIDENQNKQDRMQFLQAFGGFLAQALPVGQASPEMVPMMMELLRFGMQAFKAARPIEGQIDQTLQQLVAAAQQRGPDSQQQGKQAELQAKGQMEASKMQMESALTQAKMQHEMQMEQLRNQAKLALEQQKMDFDARLKAAELQAKQSADRYKADLDAQTKLIIAQMGKTMPTPPYEQ